MARWEPDAGGRLAHAAMTLFLERGYADVTVADIARQAGLTKRSFFNHFADKREIFFAGAGAFETSVIDHLARADPSLDPLHAALAALTHAGRPLAVYADSARPRRELIASSTELQERELIKLASLSHAITRELVSRGMSARAAALTAQSAINVFNAAVEAWIDAPDSDLADLVDDSLTDLRAALASPRPR